MFRAFVLASLGFLLVGCRKNERTDEVRPTPGSGASAALASVYADPPLGDAQRGKTLVAKFECNRCHA